jgi:hypothetical protein
VAKFVIVDSPRSLIAADARLPEDVCAGRRVRQACTDAEDFDALSLPSMNVRALPQQLQGSCCDLVGRAAIACLNRWWWGRRTR